MVDFTYENKAKPVSIMGESKEMALDAPTHSDKREGVYIALPGATGAVIGGTLANPLQIEVMSTVVSSVADGDTYSATDKGTISFGHDSDSGEWRSLAVDSSGHVFVTGPVARGANVTATYPQQIGGYAIQNDWTGTIGSGTCGHIFTDDVGRLLDGGPAPRALTDVNEIVLTDTTLTDVFAADVNYRHSITFLLVSNTSATPVRIDFFGIKSASALPSIALAGGETKPIEIGKVPLYGHAINTAFQAQLSAGVTDVRITAITVLNR